MNIPNIISLGRLLAVPVTVWLILDEQILTAFWLFIAAGISDAVDGFIAKRFAQETVLGAFLDPLADKTLLVCTYISLGYVGLLDLWLVILVVFRDGMILAGAFLYQALTQSLTMEPLKISKVNTAFQIILASVVLGTTGMNIEIDAVKLGLVICVTGTTFLSGATYVITWGRRASLLETRK